MTQSNDTTIHTEVSTRIIKAYLSNNDLPANELPEFIGEIVQTVNGLANQRPVTFSEKQDPAVSIEDSLQHSHLICLEDGLEFKSLKRHLRTKYNLTPEQYRIKWDLPADYPMVAPAYAEKRSKIAKNIGLGSKRSKGDGNA